MATIAQILDAMADTLRATLEDALGSDLPIQVEPRQITNPTALTIDMYPGDPSTTDVGAGFGDITGQWVFTIRARTNTPDETAAQDLLLALMDDEDPLSVALALYDDTLNGLVSSLRVQGPNGYAPYLDAGGKGAFLGTEWRVSLLKAHS